MNNLLRRYKVVFVKKNVEKKEFFFNDSII